MLIDTHCHLDLSPLAGNPGSYLAQGSAMGVQGWLVPAIHPDGWERIARLCRQHEHLQPAFGIHPCHAGEVTEEHLRLLEQRAVQGIAVGETGLDRYCDDLPRQELLFRRQIRIACDRGLPLVVHCRDMIGRTLQILHEERADRVGGIMHAYSGSVESAREFVRLGFAIALCGTLLVRNAVKPLRLARELPLSVLVLETDAPDQAAAGEGQGRNDPGLLSRIAARLADVRGELPDLVVCETGRTACRVLPGLASPG